MASGAILAATSVGRHRAHPARSMRIGWTGTIVEAGSIVSLKIDAGDAKLEERTHGR